MDAVGAAAGLALEARRELLARELRAQLDELRGTRSPHPRGGPERAATGRA